MRVGSVFSVADRGRSSAGRLGVVRSAAEHARVIDEIEETAATIGYNSRGVIESPLLGPKGNKEFLLYLCVD